MAADSRPVIIGVGQETWRERDPSRTPIDALQAVATRAASDTGSAEALAAVDTIVHVPFILNQVEGLAAAMPRNPGAALAERLGIDAAVFTADVGGNLPQQLVNDFAARLVRGEAGMVLLCGAELLATFLGAVRAGEPFPAWDSGRDDEAEVVSTTPTMTAPTEGAHGLWEPIHAYPLIESALAHARGWNPEEHARRLGSLIARMSEVAANNPYAWKRDVLTPEEVVSTDKGNRMIAHPYTKLMNSVIAVDQAAAVILTTAGRARELGIDESRLVYLRGAASAHDGWYLSERPALAESPALRAAARAALEQAGATVDDINHFDLYSCFPSAIQVACDAVGIEVDDPRGVTVTGGMSLFGGPGNNYSLHAIASMVERLRGSDADLGLVSANGGYLTKHAVGVYGRAPGAAPWQPRDATALQTALDAARGPQLVAEGEGEMTLVAHTVKYSGGAPAGAIVLGALDGGKRCVAVSDDAAVMQRLAEENCVGRRATVTHREGLNRLRLI